MGVLAPTTKINQTVGQANEFPITQSRYGEPNPRAAGTDRFSGQVIWGQGIRQVKTTETETQGGKGGPKTKTTTTTYEYFLNFAVSFATGLGGATASQVLRIWADGKILYDAANPTELVSTTEISLFLGLTIENSSSTIGPETVDWLNFRFYGGSEDQLPDPLIESFEGENNTPAYRGQTYIVFEDFKLSDFGNRIPNITSQIAFTNAQISDLSVDYFPTLVGINGTANAARYAYNYTTKNMVIGADNTGLVETPFVYDTTTATKVGDYNDFVDSDDVVALLEDGQTLFAQRGSASSIRDEYKLFFPGSGLVVERDVDNKPSRMSPLPNLPATEVVGGGFIPTNVLFGVASGAPVIADPRGLIFINATAGTFTFVNPNSAEYVGLGNNSGIAQDAWAFLYNQDAAVPNELLLYRATIAGPSLNSTIVPADFVSGATAFDDVNATVHFDRVGNAMLIGAVISGVNYVGSYDLSNNGFKWVTTVPFLWGDYKNRSGGADLDVGNFLIWVGGDNNRNPIAINLGTGELDALYNGTTSVGDVVDPSGMWIESQGAIWSENPPIADQGPGMYRYNLQPDFAQSLNSRSLVTQILTEAGYSSQDYDVSRLSVADLGVSSFVIPERQKYNESLENLLTLIGAEVSDADGQLRFFPLDAVSSRTIPVTDLIRTNERNLEPFVQGSIRERDLPKTFEVNYREVNTEFQPATQRATRVSNPVSIALTERPEEFDYLGAGRANFMQGVAQRELYRRWAETDRYEYRAPLRYLDVAPGDTVTLDFGDGTGALGRLGQADIGSNFAIDITQLVEVSGQYTTVGNGEIGDNSLQANIPTIEDTAFFLLNLPLLRDTDDPGSSVTQFYYVANGIPFWPGATLFRTVGTNLEEVALQNTGYAGGVTSTQVPDATCTTRFEDASFDILTLFGTGNFSSTTVANVLAGSNTLAVLKSNGDTELIQFRRAELQPDGATVRVSELLRGRRGTEPYSTGYTGTQDFVFLLTANTVEPVQVPATDVGSTINFTASTLGQIIEDAASQDFTPRGEDLKPYSPVQLDATLTGSGVQLSWVRRTRIGGELTDGVDVPLSEATESYEVDILDAPGGNVLRTLSTTTPSVLYTNANITADFGAPIASIDVVVYQISAVVGRGKPATETLEVN